jgi:hypothetical protein
MGRSSRAIHTRDLPTLVSFFGISAHADILEARREEITARFAQEVREIDRLCKGLRERERFQLFREALRLAYERALLRQAAV